MNAQTKALANKVRSATFEAYKRAKKSNLIIIYATKGILYKEQNGLKTIIKKL
ncbi:hypothetical protein [Flavobacterium facile]|uniref:hypothetical protein n=1 Tax=Flavobacterium facile TaxID=2893174 RepID=UPI002E781497|nr:hypothetical protein [Flavobacterium sp. T-12]